MSEHVLHRDRAPAPIHSDAIYTDGDLRLILSVPGGTLTRARRDGRLRYTRQGHSFLYRGAWILAWLEREAQGAEVKA